MRWKTIGEVAKELGRSPSTVRWWVKRGKRGPLHIRDKEERRRFLQDLRAKVKKGKCLRGWGEEEIRGLVKLFNEGAPISRWRREKGAKVWSIGEVARVVYVGWWSRGMKWAAKTLGVSRQALYYVYLPRLRDRLQLPVPKEEDSHGPREGQSGEGARRAGVASGGKAGTASGRR